MVNLTKEQVIKKVNLLKKEVDTIAKELNFPEEDIDVVVALDRTTSMQTLYRDGTVEEVLMRLMAFALKFDRNEELDMFLYDCQSRELPSVTLDNLYDYMGTEINRYSLGGPTYYANPLWQIYRKYKDSKHPVYVLYITDGDCHDPAETEMILKFLSYCNIFVKLIGLGSGFSFLKRIKNIKTAIQDVRIGNIDFKPIKNIKNTSDRELFTLMFDRYNEWRQEYKDYYNNGGIPLIPDRRTVYNNAPLSLWDKIKDFFKTLFGGI